MMLLSLLMVAISSHALITVDQFNKDTSPTKILVFMSDTCPCSKSHESHLNQLHAKYKNIPIYAVVSEPMGQQAIEYFSKKPVSFPVIRDDRQLLVKKYKALKTPHTTILKREKGGYVAIYQGGVSNKSNFNQSTVKYLAANMNSLSQSQQIPFKNGYSLGCYIRRH